MSHVSRRRFSSMLFGLPLVNVAPDGLPLNIADKKHNIQPRSNRKLAPKEVIRQGDLKMVNARDVRNGWGVNAGGDGNTIATAMNFIGTRWIRQQFDGDSSGGMAAIQNAFVKNAFPDPNVKIQLLLNDYLQNSGTNSWNNQQNWILNSVLPIKGPNGKSILHAIEGPNEMNSGDGGGGRGPNDSNDKTGGQNVTSDNPTANANFVDWAQALYNFKQANASQLAGIELLSPTILYFFASNWSSQLNVSQYVDYGTFHYYAGINGTNGVPSFPPNPDNFAAMYKFAQAGICPGKPMVQSEGGFSTFTGGGYGQDGRSAARYILMQILDHFAMGGHRFMIYNLINNPVSTLGHVTNYNEDNFGQFYGDGVTPKASAIALHNFSNIMSLNNNYADPANFTDTAPFTPAYSGTGFSVSGLQNAGAAGSYLIMPKSDGTTVIAVWNEPQIDTGSGTSSSPPGNNITVNFGSNQNYKVYDPTGGGGVCDFNATVNSTPFTSGSGSSVNLTLYGTPLLIEIGTSGSIVPPKKVPESKNGASITKPSDNPLGDSAGNSWSLVAGSNGNQVAVNGVPDSTTAQVVALSYINKQMWQQNTGKMWWGKSHPEDAWAPAAGQASPPAVVVPVESKDGTSISKATDPAIVDSAGNQWTLVSSGSGLQVAINGVPDTTTSQVIMLKYVSKVIWQENSGNTWWGKSSTTAAWSPSAGTKTVPTPVTTTPTAPNTSSLQTLISSTVPLLTTYGTVAAKSAVTALNAALSALKSVS